MGFKQRERRRKQRAASGTAQREARDSGSSADRWWLTPLASTGCCARCGLVIREGGAGVYRHTPREVRCVPCAERREDSKGYRPSLKWERERRSSKRSAVRWSGR